MKIIKKKLMGETIQTKKGRGLAKKQSIINAVNRVLDNNIDKIKQYQNGDITLKGFFLSEIMQYFPENEDTPDKINTDDILSFLEEELKIYREPKEDGQYINSVTFTRDMIPFKDGEHFDFRAGVNLLVGDQACGKSTMLHVMMYEKSEYGGILKVNRNSFRGDYVFLDTEKHNPRNLAGESGGRTDVAAVREFLIHSKEKCNAPPDWCEKSNDYMKKWLDNFGGERGQIDKHLISNFKSHGETLLPMLESFINNKNGLIYIDEPETAMSMRSQYKLVEIIKTAVDKKNQIFIATHSRIIMEGLAETMDKPTVLSLEHRRWLTPEEFIKTQLPS